MNKLNILQIIRNLIGAIGWKLFIWADFNGDENKYFDEYEKRYKYGFNSKSPK
jgi:hypothetical protein